MLEFALAGVTSVILLINTVQLSLGMWNYHTLAYAVHEATRYASSHGRGCVTGTNSCGITVADIMRRIASNSIGLAAGALNVTLTTQSGAVTSCSPISTCSTNSTRWPPTSNFDNTTGKKITISASYTFRHSMLMMSLGSPAQQFGSFLFPASSTEPVVF
jgi:hypothetical protein